MRLGHFGLDRFRPDHVARLLAAEDREQQRFLGRNIDERSHDAGRAANTVEIVEIDMLFAAVTPGDTPLAGEADEGFFGIVGMQRGAG
jgi:hypothetical protein